MEQLRIGCSQLQDAEETAKTHSDFRLHKPAQKRISTDSGSNSKKNPTELVKLTKTIIDKNTFTQKTLDLNQLSRATTEGNRA